MYPGAVPCACVITAIVGGLRSGRERKVCTFDRLSAGSLFGVFISATQATPAPTALRNFPRVSFLIKVLFVSRLPRLPGASLVSAKSGHRLSDATLPTENPSSASLSSLAGRFLPFHVEAPSHHLCDPVGFITTDDESVMRCEVRLVGTSPRSGFG